MVRHIVAWNLQEQFSQEEKEAHAQRIKKELEALTEVIPGVVSIKVAIKLEKNSDREIVLDSLFINQEALEAYRIHPAHVEAGKFVRSVVQDRVALDFEM